MKIGHTRLNFFSIVFLSRNITIPLKNTNRTFFIAEIMVRIILRKQTEELQ